ncbi:MgtC/SapB family protein [Chryseosolibacter histidini]|uniref:MgtC/SapB family protein n=1 Tax=Chryseosolibacter histidini TaxID=2782349 RepID=UPI0020B390F9|nr:MgtC/SapB family protein [Chryseosolibacter histidini]
MTKLIISIVIGIIIGGEREYRNKSAGLRTIILICLGSTLFTILSSKIGDAMGASRVAANIVTGIGFLGAGAIMREGLTISGLTTASTIWVAAALGMAVGAGEYALAFYSMALTFIVLTGFGYLQQFFFRVLNRTIELHLTLEYSNNKIELIEDQMRTLTLKYYRKKEFRKDNRALYQYDVVGKEKNLASFMSFLSRCELVKSFNY